MNNANENAYPQGSHSNGLTKREAFAMAALPQCIAVAMEFAMQHEEPVATVMLSAIMNQASAFAARAADNLLAELAK